MSRLAREAGWGSHEHEIRSAEILDIDPRESPARRRPARGFPPAIPAGEPDPAPTAAATRPTGTRGRRVHLLPRRRVRAPGTRPPREDAGGPLARRRRGPRGRRVLAGLSGAAARPESRAVRPQPPPDRPPAGPLRRSPPRWSCRRRSRRRRSRRSPRPARSRCRPSTPIGPPRSSAGADRPRAVDRGHDPGAGRLGRLVATVLATSGPTLIRSASPGSGRLVRANAPGSPRVQSRGRGREPFGACGSGSGPVRRRVSIDA